MNVRWYIVGLCLGLLATATARSEDKPKPPAERKDAILKLFAEEFVALTPGKGVFPASFEMGSIGDLPKTEQPAHNVTFKYEFSAAKYEVTQELYEAVVGKNPSRWKGPRNSVEMVDWNEAKEFCSKVTEELRTRKLIGETDVVRLPTEAEWEYACRAGTKTKYAFGDKEDDLKDYAWFKGNSKGEDPPVGKKKPNTWGLYDMHGYIKEWCLDSWEADYKNAPADGSALEKKDAKERVVRGGSWADPAEESRSAFRKGHNAKDRLDTIGFRCVRVRVERK